MNLRGKINPPRFFEKARFAPPGGGGGETFCFRKNGCVKFTPLKFINEFMKILKFRKGALPILK